jgi:hypothetical protein
MAAPPAKTQFAAFMYSNCGNSFFSAVRRV